ncbi:MAG: pitrilysin family protein [Candidatus Hydrogenedentota bacterium]
MTPCISLAALKTNLSESIDIFADVLLNPAFDAQEFSRLQKQAVAGIQQERSTPAGAGLRVLPALLFGADHAYGNPLSGSGTEASVQALMPADLKKFHETWFKPNNATLIVVGDTTLAEMSALLETALGGWARGEVPAMAAGKVALAQSSRVFLIDRPGAQQSYIFAALVAPPPAQVNEEAVDTMNRVFGGTFTSRINMNLREDKHWSYGARSSLYDGRIQRAFVATAPVQTDKTRESLVELSKELDEIVGARPITEEESAKSIQNQVLRLPGLWETSGAVKSSLREMVAYGLPDDYFDSYADRIRGLALADVTKAANEVIHPASVTWLVVGDLALVEQGVRDLGLGPVTVIADESAVLK